MEELGGGEVAKQGRRGKGGGHISAYLNLPTRILLPDLKPLAPQACDSLATGLGISALRKWQLRFELQHLRMMVWGTGLLSAVTSE
jgi:hypothetical protein